MSQRLGHHLTDFACPCSSRAPTLSNRSPQKPVSSGHRNPSPSRSTRSSHRAGEEYEEEEESNESFSSARAKETGAVRYARLKQRNQALGPGTIISPPKPNGTNFKDTSVNIASAFNQAAAASVMPANGRTSRPPNSRGTKETYNPNHTTTTASRDGLPGPPRRAGSKPVSRGHEVVDSDEELQMDGDTGRPISRATRAKSPLESVAEAVGGVVRALSPAATFFVRQKRGDHDDDESTTYQSMVIPPDSQRSSYLTVPSHGSHGNISADSSDYNYSREEAMVEGLDGSNKRAKKRGRISVDNKAYKPGGSDHEVSSETDEDEPGGRRKKKKVKALVNNLPTIGGYSTSKRKAPKKKGAKGSKAQTNDDDASGAEANVCLLPSQLRSYLTHL